MPPRDDGATADEEPLSASRLALRQRSSPAALHWTLRPSAVTRFRLPPVTQLPPLTAQCPADGHYASEGLGRLLSADSLRKREGRAGQIDLMHRTLRGRGRVGWGKSI